jgi:hypothetical protein
VRQPRLTGLILAPPLEPPQACAECQEVLEVMAAQLVLTIGVQCGIPFTEDLHAR